MEITRELWDFMKIRKKFWMAPIIMTMVMMAGLMVASGAAGHLSIFIYGL